MTGGKPPRPRPRLRREGPDEVPELSDEEVERRVALRALPASTEDLSDLLIPADAPVEPVQAGPAEAASDAMVTDRQVVRASGPHAAVDRRRILWRDSATVLVFVVLALLGARAFLPGTALAPVDTPLPSGVVTGTRPPGFSLPPGVTFGPIIDPSLGIDATPTPIPVITLGPSPSPSPKTTPKPKPPTPKPTTPKPATPPPPTDPPPSAAATIAVQTDPPPTDPTPS